MWLFAVDNKTLLKTLFLSLFKGEAPAPEPVVRSEFAALNDMLFEQERQLRELAKEVPEHMRLDLLKLADKCKFAHSKSPFLEVRRRVLGEVTPRLGKLLAAAYKK